MTTTAGAEAGGFGGGRMGVTAGGVTGMTGTGWAVGALGRTPPVAPGTKRTPDGGRFGGPPQPEAIKATENASAIKTERVETTDRKFTKRQAAFEPGAGVTLTVSCTGSVCEAAHPKATR